MGACVCVCVGCPQCVNAESTPPQLRFPTSWVGFEEVYHLSGVTQPVTLLFSRPFSWEVHTQVFVDTDCEDSFSSLANILASPSSQSLPHNGTSQNNTWGRILVVVGDFSPLEAVKVAALLKCVACCRIRGEMGRRCNCVCVCVCFRVLLWPDENSGASWVVLHS